MLIRYLVDNDLEHCNKVFRQDKELKDIEREVDSIIDSLTDNVVAEKLEELFNAYGARTARLAYLQGIKDFRELFVELKGETNDIIEKMEQRIIGDRERVSNVQ